MCEMSLLQGVRKLNVFLIHRLLNAAIAADQRGDPATAAIITEAINELEKHYGCEPQIHDIQRGRNCPCDA